MEESERKEETEGDWRGRENKLILSFCTLLPSVSLLIIISAAAILCVPKEITMIQREASHLSSPACWPECKK